MDEFRDHLARINCVLGQAAVELTADAYFELLVELFAQIESDLQGELGGRDEDPEDRDDRANGPASADED